MQQNVCFDCANKNFYLREHMLLKLKKNAFSYKGVNYLQYNVCYCICKV